MYSWNTTIDDTSSIILFSPYSEGPVENGWAGWFHDSQTNFATFGGEQASGDSIHYTQFPGASLYLQFEGTAIYLYGTANCSYDITLDSQSVSIPSSLPFGLLYYKEGLAATSHSVQLTAHPAANATQMVGFDRATFTNTIDQDTTGLVPTVFENWNDTLHYTGSWGNVSGVEWIPNTSNPQPYVETNVSLSSVSLNFTGGVAVAINAPRNWGHWTYNVTLDGQVSNWNCSTLWGIGDTVLFYQNNLDPAKEHSIELLNTGMESYYKLSLNYFTVWHPNGSDLETMPSSSISSPPSSSSTSQPTQMANTLAGQHKTNVGAIVGPVVAGVVLIAILLFGGIWWRRKKQRASSEREDPVVAFPRNAHPVPWSKGQEAGVLPTTHVYEAIVPTTGSKRAMIQTATASAGPSTLPPAPTSSVPGSSVEPPTTTGGHSQQPSTSASAGPQSSGQTVDVNQIIELIAQRIDPRSNAPVGDAPPRYPAFPAQ